MRQKTPISHIVLHERRERVFLVLAGLFLGTLAMLNILGISRFILLGQSGDLYFMVAVGVLPYPLTFLCTDLISEFYGRKRANWVVAVGVLVNLWVVFIMWLGGVLPTVPDMDPTTGLPPVPVKGEDGKLLPSDFAFYYIRSLTFGAVFASMIAYLVAQFVDVYVFHFWKRLTRGKHLWLRNNGSTLISQLVDTIAVILITHYYARALPLPAEGTSLTQHLLLFIFTGYMFKLAVALLDTPLIYLAVWLLKDYLHIDPINEHDADVEEVAL